MQKIPEISFELSLSQSTVYVNTDYSKRKVVMLSLVGGIFLVGYFAQLLSPLRLNTDVARLLSMAVSAFQGHGYLVSNQVDQYPIGYPFIVRLLLHAGLANSNTLILMNLCFLALGVGMFTKLTLGSMTFLQRCILMVCLLASWVLIKHITLPVSDVLYLGISFVCLFFLERFHSGRTRRKWWWLGSAVLASLAATMVRSVGIVFVPVFLCLLCCQPEIQLRIEKLLAGSRKFRFVAIVVGVFLLAVILVSNTTWFEIQFVRQSGYFQSFLKMISNEGFLSLAMKTLSYRFLEIGELVVNIPSSKFPQLGLFFYLAGGLTWLLIMYGLFLHFKERNLLPVLLYFVAYIGLIFIWPYYDSRFWLPIIPIVILLLFKSMLKLKFCFPSIQWAINFFLVVFLLHGLVGLAYSIRISLAGKYFSEVYGDGSTKMTYRYAFQNGLPVDLDQVDPSHLRLLGIFEPLTVKDQIETDKNKP